VLPEAGKIGRGSSQWLPPLPFCNFHRALTFRLHSVNTAHRPCLPAYIKCVPQHIPHHCSGGPACLLTQRRAAPPRQLCRRHLQLCALCSEDIGGRRPVGRRLLVHLPAPPVSSACALISPIWAYITAAWSPDGRTANDYLTSP